MTADDNVSNGQPPSSSDIANVPPHPPAAHAVPSPTSSHAARPAPQSPQASASAPQPAATAASTPAISPATAPGVTGTGTGAEPTAAAEPARPRRRGFAAMDRERVKEIASKGGKAAHAAGTAHQFSSDEARTAGRKGGMAPHVRRGGVRRRPVETATSPAEAARAIEEPRGQSGR